MYHNGADVSPCDRLACLRDAKLTGSFGNDGTACNCPFVHKCSCGLCHDARSAVRDEKTEPGLSASTSLPISVSQTHRSKESGLRPVTVHSCHALCVQTGRTLAQDVEKSCSYDLRMMRQFCKR